MYPRFNIPPPFIYHLLNTLPNIAYTCPNQFAGFLYIKEFSLK